jgi:anti-sigma B factor antagonist
MKERQVESITILTPRGYLTGGDETDELQQKLAALADGGNKHLIINLSETQHLNSTALGVLISAHSNYTRRGGHMKLCSVDQRIQNIFVITKLSYVFDTYPNEVQAIASFAESRSV